MVYSFVIINYNTKNFLKQCIKGILNLNLTIPHEILIVDVASTDGSAKMVKELFPEIKVICSPINVGHSAGSNLGIKEAKGKYIVLLNTDIIFLNNPFQKILDFMEKNTEVGILAPKLLNPNKSIQISAMACYKLLTPLYRRTFLGKIFGKDDLARFTISNWDRNSSKDVDWVIDACAVVRRVLFEKIGLYDERFFMYTADLDLCNRAWKNGYKVHYMHDAGDIIHYFCRESSVKNIGKVLFNRLTRVHIVDFLRYIIKYKKEWKNFV